MNNGFSFEWIQKPDHPISEAGNAKKERDYLQWIEDEIAKCEKISGDIPFEGGQK